MATILENESAWSTTAATNATVDTGINWAENQDPASINNSARGMMAARRKAALDQGGALVATGTGDAITVTTNQVLSAAHITAGQRLTVRATAANTVTAVTFAPDGLTAAPIKTADGTALAVGSITSGMMLDLVYNSGSSEWRCVNIAPIATPTPTGASKASFRANKNGTNQNTTTNTSVKLTFTTEVWDVGSYYDAPNSKWTPPTGTVLINAQLQATAFTAVNASLIITLRKNGVSLMQGQRVTTGPVGALPTIGGTWIDQSNGTDYYEIYVFHTDSAANAMDGNIVTTWFSGTMI